MVHGACMHHGLDLRWGDLIGYISQGATFGHFTKSLRFKLEFRFLRRKRQHLKL